MQVVSWSRLLLIFCFASAAAAKQFPEPEAAAYRSFTFPPEVRPAAIPAACQSVHRNEPCRADSELELALEREYWAYVQRSDNEAMQAWIQKTKRYAELSHSLYQDRLLMLAAFGEVMVFRGHSLHDPKGLIAAAQALRSIDASHRISSEVPSTISMRQFLRTFIAYSLKQTQDADARLESLLDLPSIFGDNGSEGVVVGAFGLMALVDKAKVQRGLAILDDCHNPYCSHTTSIAPYKMVGNAIAMAEAEAYLGHADKARELLQNAATWARERYYPAFLLERLQHIETELLDPKQGLAQAWQRGAALGAIRMPLGPSQSHYACASCHAGNEIPATYYTWRKDQQP